MDNIEIVKIYYYKKSRLNLIKLKQKEKSAIIIQKFWRNYKENKLYKEIFKILLKYNNKMTSRIKTQPLTLYEKAIGFTDSSASGTINFNNYMGRFMEDIYDLSSKFNKLYLGGIDGDSDNIYYECKNKFNTMKGSSAIKEIQPKLEKSIQDNKHFYLLILNDKNNENNNKPLHLGTGLKKIQDFEGYNEDKHRWISGDVIYDTLFNNNGMLVKQYILELLISISF